METSVKKKILIAVAVLLLGLVGIMTWRKLYRVVPQPAWISADPRDQYFYGSVGAEQTPGIPYWLWLAMPRMFPEYMPSPGGYAALGMSWEEGKEMPVGFAKQRIGYIRVTGNCALCHAVSQSTAADQPPIIIPAVAGRATDVQPLLTFYRRCAQDPRFTADDFLSEIDTYTKLSFTDRLLYRYVLIPRMREALLDAATLLFDPAIREHSRNPQSDAPFSEQPMKGLKEQVKTLGTQGP
jgi:hypothetical protein